MATPGKATAGKLNEFLSQVFTLEETGETPMLEFLGGE